LVKLHLAVRLLAMNEWQRVEVRDNLHSLGQPFAEGI
jgi:hypothetical protein